MARVGPASRSTPRRARNARTEAALSRAARPLPAADAARGVVRGRAAEGVPPEFDRLIHERIRLGILSALAVNASLSFQRLKKLLGTSDGNLSVHARKLEEAQYVSCTKSFQGRLPRTEYRITPLGRRALERYLAHMEALIRATRNGRES